MAKKISSIKVPIYYSLKGKRRILDKEEMENEFQNKMNTVDKEINKQRRKYL